MDFNYQIWWCNGIWWDLTIKYGDVMGFDGIRLDLTIKYGDVMGFDGI